MFPDKPIYVGQYIMNNLFISQPCCTATLIPRKTWRNRLLCILRKIRIRKRRNVSFGITTHRLYNFELINVTKVPQSRRVVGKSANKRRSYVQLSASTGMSLAVQFVRLSSTQFSGNSSHTHDITQYRRLIYPRLSRKYRNFSGHAQNSIVALFCFVYKTSAVCLPPLQ